MDLEEARRLVYTRVQSLDPANVLKIMGYLLLQDIGEEEMVQLAMSSDVFLHGFVSRAKQELGHIPLHQEQQQLQQQQQQNDELYNANVQQQQQQEFQHPSMQQQQQQEFQHPSMQQQQQQPPYISNLYELLQYQDRIIQRSKSPEVAPAVDSYLSRLTRSNFDHQVVNTTPTLASPSSSSTASAWKPCLYFARGYCKHGSTCRFLHTTARSGSYSPASDDSQESQVELVQSESLEALESELRELLGGRVTPVSIASLPQLYYERFGKTLQADGYLTESQRHGKAGYSLTKLLSKLKSTVTLIDRPHGQHAVVLSDEAHKFAAYRCDAEEPNLVVVNPSSRQIYLTFPAESGFSEEDVTTHFSAYGPVQDVRIPYQQKRMFGFVTFTYSETVRTILAEGNPHYICGARVLVKPYKEKTKHLDKQTKLLQSRSFDRNRHQQAALRCYLQDRTMMTDEELTAALEQKLAELHIASIQKRMAETLLASAAVPSHPTYLESPRCQFKPEEQQPLPPDLSQLNNPYGYVLDVVDSDSADEPLKDESSSKKQQALPCNIQSDQKKFMTIPRDNSPPTFFSHDIF